MQSLRLAFEQRLEDYRSHHRTLGCKITHLVGVPLLVFSLPALLFSRHIFAKLQLIGWLLQFAGHYIFEHNQPLLFEKQQPLLTFAAALTFVLQEWQKTVNGELRDESKQPQKST